MLILFQSHTLSLFHSFSNSIPYRNSHRIEFPLHVFFMPQKWIACHLVVFFLPFFKFKKKNYFCFLQRYGTQTWNQEKPDCECFQIRKKLSSNQIVLFKTCNSNIKTWISTTTKKKRKKKIIENKTNASNTQKNEKKVIIENIRKVKHLYN